MKNIGYTINRADKAIIITKDFAKRSGIIGSEEYNTLVQFQKDYPNYKVLNRTAAKNTRKTTHSGLTIAFMAKYISAQGDADNVLEAFGKVKNLYEGHPAYYAKVKAWFLKKYPDYGNDKIAA